MTYIPIYTYIHFPVISFFELILYTCTVLKSIKSKLFYESPANWGVNLTRDLFRNQIPILRPPR